MGKLLYIPVRCGYRLLGAADEVLLGPDKTKKGVEVIEQIEKCRADEEVQEGARRNS